MTNKIDQITKKHTTILFLTYCRAMLGANKSLLALMLDLRTRYNVSPLVLMYDIEDGTLAEELEKNDIPYIVTPMKFWVVGKTTKLKYLRGFKGYLENKKNLKHVINQIKNLNIDLIYTNNSTVQIGAMLADKLKIPHIWHVREFGGDYGDYDFVYNYPDRLVQKWFSKAASVITISDAMCSYVKDNIGKYANVLRVYNGVTNNKPPREQFNKNEKLQLCIVGALCEGKNQFELIQAANLLKDTNSNFHITIIGDGEEYKNKLISYIKYNKLDDYVTFLGYRNDVPSILDTMDVGVICSKAEGFGRVTVEYMFASMPVIGANCGGTPEIIADNETGFLYKPGNYEQLSKIINKLINDRNILQNLAINAYKNACEIFYLEKNTDKIYEQIINSLN